MLTALVLVCSLAVTPNLHDCTRDNAVDVVQVPDTFGNPAFCFMSGQAYFAGTAMGRNMAKDERVKVVCSHDPQPESVKPVQRASLH
jgi:hypothetical protein